ncbi:MAG: FAD-binding protein [Coriobacteriales bacterium]
MKVAVVGAGLAGCSAAINLAHQGVQVLLISNAPSERAQSVMAEGGINAALDSAHHGDSAFVHAADTLSSAAGLAVQEDVEHMAQAAPGIVEWLERSGAGFNLAGGELAQRPFGGQTEARTVFAKSQTGKQIMAALIQQLRPYESAGTVQRLSRHSFQTLLCAQGRCCGVRVRDLWTGELLDIPSDAVIIACGGMGGMFPVITGSKLNSGSVQAELLRLGVEFSNLEFIQYHPTAVVRSGKALLMTEAARAEGGRLFALRDGEPWYFMEERHPQGNLAPRDVTARNNWLVGQVTQVYLDLRGLPKEKYESNLRELVEKLQRFAHIDPRTQPVPIQPAIHFFMGGLHVDSGHRCSMPGLYAAGECDMKYHGANRLGGNSLLGGIYGGTVAAHCVLHDAPSASTLAPQPNGEPAAPLPPGQLQLLRATLGQAMGIVRSKQALKEGLAALEPLGDHPQAQLARAFIGSALAREESRGAHYRDDFPQTRPAFDALSTARLEDGQLKLGFAAVEHEEEPCA